MSIRDDLYKELEHEVQFYSEHTKEQYRAHVSNYLDFIRKRDGSLESWRVREVLYSYLDYLKKRGLGQAHINYIVRGPIGCLFRMSGLRLPVKLPKVGTTMLDLDSRKSFTGEEIIQLIGASRASKNMQWQNVMALSSVYGLRAGEIRGVQKVDVHPQKHTIVVHTEKGGMLREHLVPPQIAPVVLKYDYPRILGNTIFDLFHAIAAAAGVERNGKGLHGVRHGVMTVMDHLRTPEGLRVFDKSDLFRFFRWKGGGMFEGYVTPDFQDLDKKIFTNHPFLKYWG